ncbi:MAG: histidine kinase [Thermodesulfobacteriota bacterium]
MATEDFSNLKSEIEKLQAEKDQLEAAWPPHGAKPRHLQRLLELEEEIENKTRRLAELSKSGHL